MPPAVRYRGHGRRGAPPTARRLGCCPPVGAGPEGARHRDGPSAGSLTFGPSWAIWIVLLGLLAGAILGAGAGPGAGRATSPAVPTSLHPSAVRPSTGIGPLYFENTSQIASYGSGTFCAPNPSGPTMCYPQSQSPSAIELSNGELGLGYSEVTTTNATTCFNGSANSISRLAFAVSSTGGRGFGPPAFLGSIGSAACPYFQEIEPSFAAGPSGEVVAAYIGANATRAQMLAGFNPIASAGGLSAPIVGYYSRPMDAVVFLSSTNNGATWSSGSVVVSGANLARPQVAVDGSTIYIVYENAVNSTTSLPGQPFFPSESFLVVSNNGGASWGHPIPLPGENPAQHWTSFSPSISVGPGGEIAVAYVTNRGCAAYCQLPAPGTQYWAEDTVLITSSNNGTTWSAIKTLGRSFEPNYQGYGTVGGANTTYLFEFGQSTSVDWDAASGSINVAWSGAYNLSGPISYMNYYKPAIFEATSTNGGSSWSTTRFGAPMIYSPSIALEGYYAPFVTESAGTIYLAYAYYNDSLPCGCASPVLSRQYSEWVDTSSNGVSWTPPVLAAMFPASDGIGAASYQGYVSSIAFNASGDPVIASALATGWLDVDGAGDLVIASNVTVSYLSSATTTSVSFYVTGLPSATPWSVGVDGNVYAGTSSSAIVATGIPVGEAVLVAPNVTEIPKGPGEYLAVRSTAFEKFSASASQTWNASEWAAVNVSIAPGDLPFASLSITGPNQTERWNWVSEVDSGAVRDDSEGCGLPWYLPVGAHVLLGPAANASAEFDGVYSTATGDPVAYWNGTGRGHYTGFGSEANLTIRGPINETLWIVPEGTYNVSFEANDLPTGTAFRFDFNGSGRSGAAGQTTVVRGVPTGVYALSEITATNSQSGWQYFGFSSLGEPVAVPEDPVVPIDFADVQTSASPIGVSLHAPGLASDDAWAAEFNGTRYAGVGPWINLTSRPGVFPLSLQPWIAANGSVAYVPAEANATVTVTAASPVVAIAFDPEERITLVPGSGGAVAPGSAFVWVTPGGSVALSAIPDVGFGWNGWTGTGPGAYTGSNVSIRVTPLGPIVEAASFYPLVPDRFNLTFVESGIPNGTEWTVDVDGTPYGANSTSLTVPGLYSCQFSGNLGRYGLYLPYVVGGDPDLPARYVPTLAPGTACGGTSVALAYVPQFLVTIAATTGGSVSANDSSITLFGGSTWFPSGDGITLHATATGARTPAGPYVFQDWTGIGVGNYSGGADDARAQVDGPLTETAVFVVSRSSVSMVTIRFVLASTLSPGTIWSVVLSNTTYATRNSSITIDAIESSLEEEAVVPDPAGAPTGVEYLPTRPTIQLDLGSNSTTNVSYRTDDWVSIGGVGPGSTGPVSGWFALGASINLTASPLGGSLFEGWSGNGTGAYTGAAATAEISVRSPMQEVASFRPVGPSAGGSPSFLLGALGGLGGLVLGAGLALLLRRRRGNSPSSVPATEPEPAAELPGPTIAETAGVSPSERRRRAPIALVSIVLVSLLVLSSGLLVGLDGSGPASAPANLRGGPWHGVDPSAIAPLARAAPGSSGPLEFVPTGLPAGTPWAVEIDGSTLNATAPAPIRTIIGTAGAPERWRAAAGPGEPGFEFRPPTGGTLDAASGSWPSKVVVAFSTLVAVEIRTVPALEDPTSPPADCNGSVFQWDDRTCPQANYAVTPGPGTVLVPVGSAVVLNATPLSIACSASCPMNPFANLTFLSWTGSGSGSENSTTNLTVIHPDGPVVETANFRDHGYCQGELAPAPSIQCVPSDAPLTFVVNGTAPGATWGVTAWSESDPGLPVESATTDGASLALDGPAVQGIASYLPWYVNGSGGTVYEPVTNATGTVESPQTSVVNLEYASFSNHTGAYPALVRAYGLPNGSTPWTVDLAGLRVSAVGSFALTTIAPGRDSVNASALVLANATEYRPSAVQVETLVAGLGWQNSSTAPATFSVAGPVLIEVEFAPYFDVWVGATPGGNVTSPGDRWVVDGGSIHSVATPASGEGFLGWSSDGAGGYTGSSATLSATVIAPIRELASFRALPGATDQLTVRSAGLPSGLAFTVSVNGTGYAGNGTVALPPVPRPVGGVNASLAIAVPAVLENGTTPTRYVPSAWRLNGIAAPEPFSGFSVNWTGNVSAIVTFTEQVLLETVAVGPGSVAPGPGRSWVNSSAELRLTAEPARGSEFVGWSGEGAGSVNSTALAIQPTPTGPIVETAQFSAFVGVPATFTLELYARGLPEATAWTATVGDSAFETTGPALAIDGLNGSTMVSVAPVSAAPGIRYVPSGNGSLELDVVEDGTADVNFTEQFEVVVNAGAGGTARANATWVTKGEPVALRAVPAAGETLLNWSGSAYSGTDPSTTILVTAPVVEGAVFAPAATTSPASGPSWFEIGAFAGIGLLVGVGIGLLATRRPRSGPGAPPAEPEPEEAAPEGPIDEPPL